MLKFWLHELTNDEQRKFGHLNLKSCFIHQLNLLFTTWGILKKNMSILSSSDRKYNMMIAPLKNKENQELSYSGNL